MKNDLTVVNDGWQVSRRTHEVERLSKRIAVLEQMLSVLRAEFHIGGPNDSFRRAALCVRRPIAERYQTPAESGNRRASSRI
jgi:hypothetical protein